MLTSSYNGANLCAYELNYEAFSRKRPMKASRFYLPWFNPYLPAPVARTLTLAARKPSATCRSLLRHRGGAGNKAPPPMHRMRCLGIPLEIQRRRRNCTKAVPFHCVSGDDRFLSFHPTLSQTRRWLLFLHHPPRGESVRLTLLRARRGHYTPSHRGIQGGICTHKSKF